MMREIKGDLFKAKENVIAHGCNCLGVMGAGVAYGIRELWPKAYKAYVKKHETEGLKLGEVQLVAIGKEKYIANLMTQQNTGGGRQVDYEAVAKSFRDLHATLPAHYTIAIPRIGAGLAGGNWEVIWRIIEDETNGRDVTVYNL